MESEAVAKSTETRLKGGLAVTYRRLDVQGLRAVAVLAVVAFHTGAILPGGFVGVDVFFVISGYVITAMLLREWTVNRRVRLIDFYWRRFTRLTPALALMVTVTALLSILILSPFSSQDIAAATGLGSLFLCANFVIAVMSGGYFGGPAELNPFLNTWSLSVEEQFYLVFPVLLVAGLLLARRFQRRNIPIMTMVAIGVVSFWLAVAGPSLTAGSQVFTSFFGFYSPFTRAWEFIVGAMVALVATRVGAPSMAWATRIGFVGAIAIVASFFLISERTQIPGLWSLLPVLGTASLIYAGSRGGPVTDTLMKGPLVKIGDWSYSIYLWHWPFIVFASILFPSNELALIGAAFLSLGPALLSYRFVETPLRTKKRGGSSRGVKLGLAVLAPPILAVGLLWGAGDRLLIPIFNPSAANLNEQNLAQTSGCISRGPFSDATVEQCTWNSSMTGKPIYLVGDSNAAHFSDGLVAAAEHLNRPVTVLTAPACPLVSGVELTRNKEEGYVPISLGNSPYRHCSAYVDFAMRWLGRAKPGTVVWAASDQYWWDPSITARSVGDGYEGSTNLEALRNGLTATLFGLREQRHETLVVQALPSFLTADPQWDIRSCSTLAILTDTCKTTLSAAEVDDIQGPSSSVLVEVANIADAELLDVSHLYCDPDCTPIRDGTPAYVDSTHITAQESRNLESQFLSALRKVG